MTINPFTLPPFKAASFVSVKVSVPETVSISNVQVSVNLLQGTGQLAPTTGQLWPLGR